MQKKKLFILFILSVALYQLMFNNFFYGMLFLEKSESEPAPIENVETNETPKYILPDAEVAKILPDKNDVFPTYPILRNPIPYPNYPIPVLVLACNRIGVKRSLDSVIKYRPSSTLFPLIVSQDCDDEPTRKVIQSYEGVVYLKQPNQTEYILPAKKKKLLGYFRLSRHYKWALNQVFMKFNYNSCIIVEDDLEISPDFFEYLIATKPILEKDPTLYCVSAWNDNGVKAATNVNRYDLVLRTDFFPGLGWLMLKSLWLELEPKWPEAFWDDWLRSPEIRMGRSCLRPEVSRVFNFGEQGVSRGLHYKTHLVHIVKNEKFVNFRHYDLKALMFDSFSENLLRTAYSSELTTLHKLEEDISKKPSVKSFRIKYTNKDNFKTLAKKFSIMADTLHNMPRNAFRGVVPIYTLNRWVFLCPPYDNGVYSNNT